MKNKGFTLVELLAVIVVLGLIMVIAVPSTINILEKNKKESFIADAKKIVRRVEQEDKDNNNTTYMINKKGIMGSATHNITMPDIGKSPFNKEYEIISIAACSYNSIRYYRIYMRVGNKQLVAVKGLPSSLITDDMIDLNDGTSTRYQMVQEAEKSYTKYKYCYNFD